MQPTTFVNPLYPNFNDYHVEDNFYSILFKPTNEIQVRELNQLQTILQEQISRGAQNIFKNGSLVKGCNHNLNKSSLLLQFNEKIDSSFIAYIQLNPVYLKCEKTGCVLQVLFIEEENIVVNNISEVGVSPGVYCLFFPETGIISDQFSFTLFSSSPCVWVKFNEGIVYQDGYFIRVPEQRKLVSVSLTFSGSIGFRVLKRTIQRNDVKKDNPKYLSIKLILDILPSDNIEFNKEFIEFLRVDSGNLIKDVRVPIFTELEKTLARRTMDQWGSYTVTPFIAQKKYNPAFIDSFEIELTPGKAYVAGYEFETIAPTILRLPRALDYQTHTNFYLPITLGSSITLTDFSGTFDAPSCEEIKFYDRDLGSLIPIYPDWTLCEVGSARIKSLQFNGTELTLYLFDYYSFPGRSFSEAKSVFVTTGVEDHHGRGNLTSPFLGIEDTQTNSLMFTLPDECVRSLQNDTDLSFNTQYHTLKLFKGIQFDTLPDAEEEDVYGQFTVTSSETIVGDLFSFIICPQSGDPYLFPESFVYLDEASKKIQLRVANSLPFQADVYAKIQVMGTRGKTRNLQEKTVGFSYNSSTTPTIILDKKYVKAITSILFNDTQDVTASFSLASNNTREAFKPALLHFQGTTPLNGVLTITYTYDDIVGDGFICINSFVEDIGLSDETIGSLKVRTRNQIDFRVDTDRLNYVPVHNSFFICDYSYYLGRIDILAATPAKTFEWVRGIPSKNPVPSLTYNPNFMPIYRFTIPPWTNEPKDVQMKFLENKRYTMRDIGKLENRLSTLEYYASLSLLEKETEELEILDENGFSRLKNGFVVDNFSTVNSLEYSSVDNQCSIDVEKQCLRPKFNIYNYPALYNPYESETRRTSDLITLPYSETLFIKQDKATNFINVQPFEVFNWIGTLDLFPASDEWVDTSQAPVINANLYGENDIWEQIGSDAFRSFYGQWERSILGTDESKQKTTESDSNIPISSSKVLWNPTSDPGGPTDLVHLYNTWVTSNFTQGFPATKPDGYLFGKPAIFIDKLPPAYFNNTLSSQGQASFTESTIRTSSLGESVSDVALLHFLRAKDISFKARNLKPNTAFVMLFDNDDVTSLCTPTTLVSDSSGKLEAIFHLPGGTYTLGEHIISLKNTKGSVGFDSGASAKYTGYGLGVTEQEAFVSTREPHIQIDPSTFIITPSPTPTPSITPSHTPTPTPSITPSHTPTPTPSLNTSPSPTPTPIIDEYPCGNTYCSEAVFHSWRIHTGPTTGLITISYSSVDPGYVSVKQDGVSDIGQNMGPGSGYGDFTFLKTTSSPFITVSYILTALGHFSPWPPVSVCLTISCLKSIINTPTPTSTPKISLTPSCSLFIPPTNTQTPANSQTPTRTPYIPPTSTPTPYPSVTPTKSLIAPCQLDVIRIGDNYKITSSAPWTASCEWERGLFYLLDYKGSLVIIPYHTTDFCLNNTEFTMDFYTGFSNVTRTIPPGFYMDMSHLKMLPEVSGPAGESFRTIELVSNKHLNQAKTGTYVTLTFSNGCATKNITFDGDVFSYTDPVAESFFVEETKYPEGIFVSSVDLFFRNKSKRNKDITVELRPSINGYPSNEKTIPFSRVSLTQEEVFISDDASIPTRFNFIAPIYLKPGEYHLVVRTESLEYEIWIARIGEFLINEPEKRLTNNPYIGVLLKSSNNLTWIPDSNADLKFNLNRCSFSTYQSFVAKFENDAYFSSEINKTNLYYNSLRLNAVTILPSLTKIERGMVAVKNSLLETQPAKTFVLNSELDLENEYYLEDQHILPSKGSLKTTLLPNPEERLLTDPRNNTYLLSAVVNPESYFDPSVQTWVSLSSEKETVSPVIDLQRLSYLYIKNIINKPDDLETEESTLFGGPALARYILKPVKLNQNTPSNSLRISFSGMLPTETTAECEVVVFFKVWSSLQDAMSSLREKHWQYVGTANTRSSSYIDFEFTIEPEDIAYENEIVDGFDWFTIKLVLLSKNTGLFPRIKDFRAIALTT